MGTGKRGLLPSVCVCFVTSAGNCPLACVSFPVRYIHSYTTNTKNQKTTDLHETCTFSFYHVDLEATYCQNFQPLLYVACAYVLSTFFLTKASEITWPEKRSRTDTEVRSYITDPAQVRLCSLSPVSSVY
ncbi:hypothetical protein GBA52_007911 [Prunus armeniaca]|nr:hypothetical protein GBA52_007911 [Prunus armeniaca]